MNELPKQQPKSWHTLTYFEKPKTSNPRIENSLSTNVPQTGTIKKATVLSGAGYGTGSMITLIAIGTGLLSPAGGVFLLFTVGVFAALFTYASIVKSHLNTPSHKVAPEYNPLPPLAYTDPSQNNRGFVLLPTEKVIL